MPDEALELPDAGGWLTPLWHHHANIGSLVTTRCGHFSSPPWQGFNLGANCQDLPDRVEAARHHVSDQLQMPVSWLTQVHGTDLIELPADVIAPLQYDGSFTTKSGIPCAVLTADCLPVLMARQDGSAVAAVHAGWRGLQAGILEKSALTLAPDNEPLDIWIGPGICQSCYQVSADLYQAFVDVDEQARQAFRKDGADHWRCDLPMLAAQRLAPLGHEVQQSGLCTVCDNDRFYSHRKEAQTGRFATLIWIND